MLIFEKLKLWSCPFFLKSFSHRHLAQCCDLAQHPSWKMMLEQKKGYKKQNSYSCLPELATDSWLHTAEWLWAWNRQPGQGHITSRAWYCSVQGAASACGWGQERERSEVSWTLRSQQDLLRGRYWPVSTSLLKLDPSGGRCTLALKIIKINCII